VSVIGLPDTPGLPLDPGLSLHRALSVDSLYGSGRTSDQPDSMILTVENIVPYLIDRNIVSAESVVDGDCTVVEITRRNRNFKVLRKSEAGYFVKQVKTYDPAAVSSLTREAQSYWLAKYDPGFRGISSLMPRLIFYDAQRQILVMELFPGAEDLAALHLRQRQFPVGVAATLGAALGAYHREVDLSKDGEEARKVFPMSLPWIMTLNLPYIQTLKNTDENHQKFFGILEQYPEFLETIGKIRAGWQVNSLIHGDMKWENCIICNEEMKIIDWELADLGDSAWDVGSIFQNYLSLWASREGLESNGGSIEAMQPAMAAFWNAYVGRMGLDAADRATLLEKCCRCAAVRLIQSTYEYMHYTKRLDRSGILLLQLSLNMLKDPAEAVRALLGL
jgi:hypothetical protein